MDIRLNNMKHLLGFFLLLNFQLCISQNISIKISDYYRKMDKKVYSTFIFVNSSYSSSRPYLFLVVDKSLFLKLENKIQKHFKQKQEYTDIYLIGIENFDIKNVSDLEKKIIDEYIEKILVFRNSFNLPQMNKEIIYSSINFLNKESDLCKKLACFRTK